MNQPNKLINKLTKQELLTLPGMNKFADLTCPQIRRIIKARAESLHLNHWGMRVSEYIAADQQQSDNTLFSNLTKQKAAAKQTSSSKEKYKQSIRDQAMKTRYPVDLPIDFYTSAKTASRSAYEERIKDVADKKQYQKYMNAYMQQASNGISFDIDIGDDEDKRLAFTEMLRQQYRSSYRVVVKAYTLDGQTKWFTLSDKRNLESTIGHIAGTIDLTEDTSDTNPYVDNVFAPVRYEILFLSKNNANNLSSFTIKKQIGNKIKDQVVELNEDQRDRSDGGFFPYINHYCCV